MIVLLGLSPVEPTRAASLFLVYHTARAASGRLVPTRIRFLAAAAGREGGSLLDVTCKNKQSQQTQCRPKPSSPIV